MTRKLLPLLLLLGCFGCSKEKNASKPNPIIVEPAATNDTFKMIGQVILKEYPGKDGNLVTEEEKTWFETVDGENLLIQIQQNALNQRLVDKPDYHLNLKAFQTTSKKYDRLLWEISNEGQTAMGVWEGKYFKTMDAGCCSEEHGYRLFDLKTGKMLLGYSGELAYTHELPWNYTAYQSNSATTFDAHSQKGLIGNVYCFNLPDDDEQTMLISYDIICETCMDNVTFEHTPEFEIKSKTLLEEEGFFRAFPLFKNGELLTQLDTAHHYLVLEYDAGLKILATAIDKGIVTKELLSTDQNLSKALKIKLR